MITMSVKKPTRRSVVDRWIRIRMACIMISLTQTRAKIEQVPPPHSWIMMSLTRKVRYGKGWTPYGTPLRPNHAASMPLLHPPFWDHLSIIASTQPAVTVPRLVVERIRSMIHAETIQGTFASTTEARGLWHREFLEFLSPMLRKDTRLHPQRR